MYIASLVMGIVSLVLSWIPVWGFVLAIAALVIAIIAMVSKKTEEKGKGMKIAGIILSIIATVIALIVTVSSVLLMKAAFDIVDTGKELIDDATQNMINNTTDTMNQFADDFTSTVEDESDEMEEILDDATDNNIDEGNKDVVGQITDKQEELEEASKELSNMSMALQRQILQAYDNKIISGMQARSAISQYIMSQDVTVVLMSADKTKMIATVGAKKIAEGNIVSKGEYYEIDNDKYSAEGGSVHKTVVSDFMMQGGETYINPANNYNAKLLKISGTDNVVGIVLSAQ